MRVADLCTPDPATTRRDVRLVEAANAMRANRVGELVVVDGAEGREIPVGVITDRDIVSAMLARAPEALGDLYVSDVMTVPPASVRASDMVTSALKRMRAHGIRRIPVVDDDGLLVGILAMDDVLDWVSEMLEDIVTLMGRSENREAWAGG